jgi:PAS domain S-box-containing protein
MGHLHAAVEQRGLASVTEAAGQQALIDITSAGIVASWNSVAVLLYGYQADEIIGRAAEVLCPQGQRAAEAAVLQRVLADGRHERYEAARVCKNGTVVTVLLTAAPIVNPTGAITGITTVS